MKKLVIRTPKFRVATQIRFAFYALIYLCLTLVGVLSFPNYFISKPGWIDSWINVGYGQVWPDTAFSFHYYKESRILNIQYQFLLSHFSPSSRLILQSGVASLICMLIAFWTVKSDAFSRVRYVILARSLFSFAIFFCTLNWGDHAGGVDYYNQIGGLLLLGFIAAIKFEMNQKNLKSGIFLGFISTVIVLELPQSLPLLMMIISLVFLMTKLKGEKIVDIKGFIGRLPSFLFGAITLYLVEIIELLMLRINPIRLLAGPKYLVDSLINPQTISSWQGPISFQKLQEMNHIRLFEVLYLMTLFMLLTLFRLNRTLLKDIYFTFPIIFGLGLYFFVSVLMEVQGKSFLLRYDYAFVTCLLILEIIALNILVQLTKSLPGSFIYLILISFSMIIATFSSGKIVAICVTSTSLLLLFVLFSKTRRVNARGSFLSIRILSCLLLIVGGLDFAGTWKNNKTSHSACLKDKIEAQEFYFQIASTIDQSGSRGTKILAITPALSMQGINICNERVPAGDFIYSLSSLGFPAPASIFGPLSSRDFGTNVAHHSSYGSDQLILLENDPREIIGCVWILESLVSKNQFGTIEIKDLRLKQDCMH